MNPERWIFEFTIPAGTEHAGRLVARALKMLWRAFGLRATANIAEPPANGQQCDKTASGDTEGTKPTRGAVCRF
jgi:hypothetical protein